MDKIELWDEPDLLGLIFPARTGIIYANQVGGGMCAQPMLEGFYVPLPSFLARSLEKDPLQDECMLPGYFGFSGLIEERMEWYRNRIHAVLVAMGLDDTLEVPDSDFIRATGVAEAWVPVRVTPEFSRVSLQSLRGRVAVLAYTNSD